MRIFLTVATVLCITSAPALADEFWTCEFSVMGTNQPPTARYELQDKWLVEIEPRLPYHILINNDLAVVAALGEGITREDVGPSAASPIVGAETLAFNRKTGEAIRGFVSLYGGSKAPIRGTCRRS
ncbi:MAG TPA: hypothetical protein VGT78_10830 [Rhizomicrobium sp.]|nr:hypothetical protein [Rhizomicrobium sp.]